MYDCSKSELYRFAEFLHLVPSVEEGDEKKTMDGMEKEYLMEALVRDIIYSLFIILG